MAVLTARHPSPPHTLALGHRSVRKNHSCVHHGVAKRCGQLLVLRRADVVLVSDDIAMNMCVNPSAR